VDATVVAPWGQTAGQRRELATWRLAAEVADRLDVARVLEMHPGGGQYDCVRLTVGDGLTTLPQVEINRAGRVHVRPERGDPQVFDLLDDIGNGRPAAVAAKEIAEFIGMAIPESGATKPARASRVLMRDLLEAAVARDSREHCAWVSAYEDSSGQGGSAARDHLLDELPAVAAHIRGLGGTDDAYRDLWLLRRGESVLAAVDTRRGIVVHPVGSRGVAGAAHAFRSARASQPAPDGLTRDQWAKQQRGPFSAPARLLAEKVLGPDPDPLPPGPAVSARAEWFRDIRGSLCAVMGPHEPVKQVLQVLAYALALQGDDDLLLVLPPGSAARVARLLPWLRTPVRVFVHHRGQIEEVVPPSAYEVEQDARTLAVHKGTNHSPEGAQADWVAALDELATGLGCVTAHRSSYLAWHADGRQVLRVQRGRSGLAVTAGVDYSTPTKDQRPAYSTVPTGPPDVRVIERVREHVMAALQDRANGTDVAHLEHRLQARLGMAGGLAALGSLPDHAHRELPAWRGDRARGYIDFLCADGAGTLHVVETKVGGDPTLVLQALEYWIWVKANQKTLRDHLGIAGASNTVRIDLVMAAKPNEPLHDWYLPSLLAALDGSVPWRLSEAELVGDGVTLEPERWRTLLPTERALAAVGARRWVDVAQERLLAERGPHLKGKRYPSPEAAFDGETLAAYRDLEERGMLHREVLHVRSSQAFALRVFAGMPEPSGLDLLRRAFRDAATVGKPEFEYVGPGKLLAEGRKGSGHETQIDVMLPGTDVAGARLALLIEVKFTEDGFNPCSAYESGGNPRRHVCHHDGLFGGAPDDCWQVANHGGKHSRRYPDLLEPAEQPARDLPLVDASPGCSAREGGNQVMRNLALGRALLADGHADRVAWALCAPHQHQAIWRRFEQHLLALEGIAPDIPVLAVPVDAWGGSAWVTGRDLEG